MSLDWHGDMVKSLVARAAAEGLNLAAERLKSDSNQISPKDTGQLINSSDVAQATPGNLEATVSYDTPYAVRLHEHPEYNFRHDKNPNAQGRYLEQPFDANKAEYNQIISTRVGRALS